MDFLTFGTLLNAMQEIPKGDPGTIKVGTVSKGELAVTNTGTDKDAILNFTFPLVEASDDGNGNVTIS